MTISSMRRPTRVCCKTSHSTRSDCTSSGNRQIANNRGPVEAAALLCPRAPFALGEAYVFKWLCCMNQLSS